MTRPASGFGLAVIHYGRGVIGYAVLRGMLDKDTPPDSWDALLETAKVEAATQRLAAGEERVV